MRKIKFRGKDKANHEWLYGNLEIPLLNQNVSKCFIVGNSYGQYQKHEVERNTVGQFTGLQDGNGKDIYEGDIVEAWFPGMPNNLRAKQEILFVDGCFGCGDYPLKLIDKITLKVVGNVHEKQINNLSF